MPANTNPIFSKAPQNNWAAAAVTAANTAKDGTGTVTTVFTAASPDGSYLQSLIVVPLGTNVTTVMRVFMNNGSSNATPANNILIAQQLLPLTTNSEVAPLPQYEIQINRALTAGYKINVTLGTAVAAGFAVSGHGGSY